MRDEWIWGVVVAVAVGAFLFLWLRVTDETLMTETWGPGLAKWQGGDIHIVTVTDFRGKGETTYRVDWVSREETIQISLHWSERPTVRVLPNAKLGLVVGKPGEYNVKVYDAPQGPSTAEYVADRETGEEKLKGM